MAVKKVAVIGAGASGLPAIKCCLDEGLEVVCFERTDSIGGLWHYTEEVRDGQACVMKSTVINTCKEMMCYSDFPIPKEYPIFMHNSAVLRYLNLYADALNMKNYIRFNTEVLHVQPTSNYDTTGQWEIISKDKVTRTEKTEIYDAVLVCTGHHADVNKPTFPGMGNFRGTILHSHDYKHPRGFEDKRVVVVGIGNSGGDVTVELSRTCSQVFLSTRRGSWVLNRVAKNGMPLGMVGGRRSVVKFTKLFPTFSVNKAEKKLNDRFDHEKFAIKPNHRLFQQHPTINDDLPNRIVTGSVKIKTNVKRFTETGVEFEDGTFEDNIDVVILATGYVFGFPFLDKRVLEVKDNVVNLYKYMFPPDAVQHTLAVIGCFQPVGAIMPISELQCRLATRVFKNEIQLPSSSDMWTDIRMKQGMLSLRYVKSLRHTMQVDYIPYMDELAEINGCKPNLISLFWTDPKLALMCFFGPCTPYQFRLMGPGLWKGARDAILTTWERNDYPLKTRRVPKAPKKSKITTWRVLAVFIAVIIYFLWM